VFAAPWAEIEKLVAAGRLEEAQPKLEKLLGEARTAGDEETWTRALVRGEYTLKYRLRANLAGEFRVGPATMQSMYAPEFVAYSGAGVVRVGEE
jgi:uncharacterized protein YfaS (alpha-2-macroglobulin family)